LIGRYYIDRLLAWFSKFMSSVCLILFFLKVLKIFLCENKVLIGIIVDTRKNVIEFNGAQ